RHHRALNMPAGEAPAPGAEPLHQVLVVLLPQGEIGGMAFVLVRDDVSHGTLELLLVSVSRKLAVALKAADAEIHAGWCLICMSTFDQLLDSQDLLAHVLRGFRPDQR